MAHPESRAVISRTHGLGQVAITHDRTQHYLPLQFTEIVRLRQHHSVTDAHFSCLAPAAWGPDQMIASQVESGSAAAGATTRPLDPKVQEFLSEPVIEPVHDPLGDDSSQLGIV